MPTYTFRDTNTDEIWDERMTISDRTTYLGENPHIQQIVTAPALVSGVSGLTYKTSGGFNDLLSRIGHANPYSPLAEIHGAKDPKSVKIRESVKRVQTKIGGAWQAD